MLSGGIADKLGNRYEAKWLVRLLLDVIAGKAAWLRFEGITPEFEGFECSIRRDQVVEWHQTKVNAPHGNWTINALTRKGVLTAFKRRLEANTGDLCIFISQDPAKDFRALTEAAKTANHVQEFIGALGNKQRDRFDQLAAIWGVEAAVAYDWLTRCEACTIPTREMEATISSFCDLYFAPNPSAFAILRDYLELHLNKEITTETVRAAVRESGALVIKDWSLDPTLRERLQAETTSYLQTYSPFGAGGSTIPRNETEKLTELIKRSDGPSVVLVTGVAGSGKSGVARGLIDQLRDDGTTHLAFRVDHHLDRHTSQDIGNALIGRSESPVSTLKGLEPKGLSVLIIDQIDAVSEVSGRNGAVKQAVLRMIDDVRQFRTVRMVLICRSFDLDSDARLKSLEETQGVERIGVPLLDWDGEVAPLLSGKGIDAQALSSGQKDLLCLPINLAVFLEAGSDGQTFSSRNDLFESLMQKKDRAIRTDRALPWALAAPLTALANWMSGRQKLDAPQTVLDAFPGSLDLLRSEGLIVGARNRINFFHESFFDYLFARSFGERDQSLVDLLTSTEQHLFRRTQVRQILEAFRQNDRGRYLCELESVLTDDRIRYHVKIAVTQWLGSLADPTVEERDVLLRLDGDSGKFSPLVRYALLASVGWFDLLNDEGWLWAVLNSENEDRQETVLWWFLRLVGERSEEIARLLGAWWDGDPQRGERLLHWFGFVRPGKFDNALAALCRKVIRSKPPGLYGNGDGRRREFAFSTWAEHQPEEGFGILKAHLDAWFEAHPGQHPFESRTLGDLDMHTLGEVAENSPRAFVAETIDALTRSIDIIRERHESGTWDYTFTHRARTGHLLDDDKFLHIFRSSLREIAEEDPSTAHQFLSKLDASKHELFLHLHLETIAANGEAFAVHFLGLLNNEALFCAGWHGAVWMSFADAARAAMPFLSTDDRDRLEGKILAHFPEIDDAGEMAREVDGCSEEDPSRTRRRILWSLNQSGYEQWCILETLGEDHLSQTGIDRLRQLRRKFPNAEVEQPRHVEAHWVGSPIKRDKVARMKDAQWLRAIARYNNNEERCRGRGFVDGGARELGRELQNAAKEQPARFASLLKRIPDDAHPAYVRDLLDGLAEAEEVDEGLLKEAVLDAHARAGRRYGNQIARILANSPALANDPALFDILAWYIENGEANDDETVDASKTEQEIMSVEDLWDSPGRIYFRGINGVRGYAAEALGSVLWKVPQVAEKAFLLVERRIEREPLVSVRCNLMDALVPLYNSDRLRCAQLVERLIDGPSEPPGSRRREISNSLLSPLTTRQGTHLLPYLIQWVPSVGRKLVHRLLESGDETMRMIGVWHVLRHSFQDVTYAADADRFIAKGGLYRRLAADVASEAFVAEEFRDRAEQQLIRFFNDNDEEVRKQAADVFRRIDHAESGRFSKLAKAYIESRAFEGEMFAFVRALENATMDVCELVISASEKLVIQLTPNDLAGDRRTWDIRHLQDLIKREYPASEANPKLRGRLLDVIDRMLALDFAGTDEILEAHDR